MTIINKCDVEKLLTSLFAQLPEITAEADEDGDYQENDDSHAEDVDEDDSVGTTVRIQRIVQVEPFVQRIYFALLFLGDQMKKDKC